MAIEQRIEVLEIKTPVCSLTFGEAPCTATGEPCYNTRKTCKDANNYTETTQSLYFYTDTEESLDLPRGFPTLQKVSRSPAKLNIAEADPDLKPLGKRETVRLTMIDHPYHDRAVDPYFRSRSYEAMSQGSFWSKWLARNDNYEGIECVLSKATQTGSSYAGKPRYYQLEKIDGPDSSGNVTLEIADILKRADDDRVKIPEVSPGRLAADLDDSSLSFDITPASAADAYGTIGYLSIGDEKMTYTRTGTTFTVVRGVDGSDPEEHDEGDIVQEALFFEEVRVDYILKDWIENYVGVPSEWIDFDQWNDEIETWLPTALLTARIYKPTGANKLIGELLRDTTCFFVVDLDEKKLELRAIRETSSSGTFSDDSHILAGSFKVVRRPETRITQLWLHYDMRDNLGSISNADNFKRLSVTVSDDFERARQQRIKEIFSRFLRPVNVDLIDTMAARIMSRLSQEPRTFHFSLDGEDADGLKLGDVVTISHRETVDITGARIPTAVQIISKDEKARGNRVDFIAQPFAFEFGTRLIAPDDIPEWTTATDAERSTYMFIADSDGEMSDGEDPPLIP
nr:hypothetical protein 34 [bacterium]